MLSHDEKRSVQIPAQLESLRREIVDGLSSGPARSADEIFERLENKYQATQANGRKGLPKS